MSWLSSLRVFLRCLLNRPTASEPFTYDFTAPVFEPLEGRAWLSLPPLWAAGVPGVVADLAWSPPPGHAPRPSAPGDPHAPAVTTLARNG